MVTTPHIMIALQFDQQRIDRLGFLLHLWRNRCGLLDNDHLRILHRGNRIVVKPGCADKERIWKELAMKWGLRSEAYVHAAAAAERPRVEAKTATSPLRRSGCAPKPRGDQKRKGEKSLHSKISCRSRVPAR